MREVKAPSWGWEDRAIGYGAGGALGPGGARASNRPLPASVDMLALWIKIGSPCGGMGDALFAPKSTQDLPRRTLASDWSWTRWFAEGLSTGHTWRKYPDNAMQAIRTLCAACRRNGGKLPESNDAARCWWCCLLLPPAGRCRSGRLVLDLGDQDGDGTSLSITSNEVWPHASPACSRWFTTRKRATLPRLPRLPWTDMMPRAISEVSVIEEHRGSCGAPIALSPA